MRRYYADMVIAALQDSAHASLGPVPPQDGDEFAPLAEVPPPMLPDNEAQPSECLVGSALEAAIVPELSSVCPPVAFPETNHRLCHPCSPVACKLQLGSGRACAWQGWTDMDAW